MLSKCRQLPPGWSLKASGHTEEEGKEIRFLGNVRIDGMADATTVSGINVEFRDANRTLLRMVRIGQPWDERFRGELNLTFNQPPEFVLVKVESVDTSEDYTEVSEVYERGETGGLPGYCRQCCARYRGRIQ